LLLVAALVLGALGACKELTRPSEESCRAAFDHALDAGMSGGISSLVGTALPESAIKPFIRKCREYASHSDLKCIGRASSYKQLGRCKFFSKYWDLL